MQKRFHENKVPMVFHSTGTLHFPSSYIGSTLDTMLLLAVRLASRPDDCMHSRVLLGYFAVPSYVYVFQGPGRSDPRIRCSCRAEWAGCRRSRWFGWPSWNYSSKGNSIVVFNFGNARCRLRLKLSQFGAARINAVTAAKCSFSFGCPRSGVNH